MKIFNYEIKISTKGNGEIIDITDEIQSKLKESRIKEGFVIIFHPGSTGSITTMEYEHGLVSDTRNLFERLVPDDGAYSHDASHALGNAPSHLRATLLGPSLTIPVNGSTLMLGTWQQVVFIDFDNRPRQRKIIVKIIGE